MKKFRKQVKIGHFLERSENGQKSHIQKNWQNRAFFDICEKQAKIGYFTKIGKNGQKWAFWGKWPYFGNSAKYDKHTRHVQYNKIIKNMNHYITYL